MEYHLQNSILQTMGVVAATYFKKIFDRASYHS